MSMIFAFVFSALAWRDPVGIPLEMYSKDTYASKIDGMSPLLIVCACHVPGFARSLSPLIDAYQTAAQYVAAYEHLPIDWGILYEEPEQPEQPDINNLDQEPDVYVTVHSPNITDVHIPITEKTLPKILAKEILAQVYNNYKQLKKKEKDEENPEIVALHEQIKLQEKLIRTAVDKADARLNQAKKEELMEKLKEFIPADKLERNRIRSDIKACVNETEKAELEAKLEVLKQQKDRSNYTKLDIACKLSHDAYKEVLKFASELDREQELKDLKNYREEMMRIQEENDYGEEEDSMAQIYKAAAEVADNDKDREEYADKADKFGKLKKLKLEHKANMTRERKEKLRKEKIAKRRAEIGEGDGIQIPDEELLSDDEDSDGDLEDVEVEEGEIKGEYNPYGEEAEFEPKKPKVRPKRKVEDEEKTTDEIKDEWIGKENKDEEEKPQEKSSEDIKNEWTEKENKEEEKSAEDIKNEWTEKENKDEEEKPKEDAEKPAEEQSADEQIKEEI